jgi:hypothetical protein
VEVPEPVELPPPECVPLEPPPVTTGGMVTGQGRKKIPPQPGLTLPALAVIGKAATRTIATARVPSTFFMTFSFFKTVFVSIRFSFSFPSCQWRLQRVCPFCRRLPLEAPHARRIARIGPSVLRRRILNGRSVQATEPLDPSVAAPLRYPFGVIVYPFG